MLPQPEHHTADLVLVKARFLRGEDATQAIWRRSTDGKPSLCYTGRIMGLDILLDKIPHMRDESLDMERALARFQKEAMELHLLLRARCQGTALVHPGVSSRRAAMGVVLTRATWLPSLLQ
jgi:hypothetical protein